MTLGKIPPGTEASSTPGAENEHDATVRATLRPPSFVLRLYVASLTSRSMTAIRSVKDVCETHLQGHYELEIIDICEHPTLARSEQIVAAPTLLKKLPLPLRRLIGDMADHERVLIGLDLREKDVEPRD